MQWVIENWLLVIVGVAMIGMHLFGHRHGHVGKDGHDHGLADEAKKRGPKNGKRAEENTDA